MKRTMALFLLGITAVLGGCNDSPAPSDLVSNDPLLTAPEGEPYRTLLAPEVEWIIAPGMGGECAANEEVVSVVREAVKGVGEKIAGVDFAALSLPKFVTVTRTLKLDGGSWNSAVVEIDACGGAGGQREWQIYSVKGPEIEQRAELPLVHRWANVYALYSVQERAVVKLLATVRGFVLE